MNSTLKLLQDDPLFRQNPDAKIAWEESPNIDVRKPQLIILHHTEMSSAESALETLKTRNPNGPVSAHYLIGQDGRIFQLVPEGARAWHAGLGRWHGRIDLNSASLGIELDNDGRSPFAEPQIEALLWLLGDLCSRLGIEKQQIIAHGDIAPTRKSDPSALFPWQRLAKAGFGLWPRAEFQALVDPGPDFNGWVALALIGYDLKDRSAAAKAFRRHFFAVEGAHKLDFSPQERAVLADLQAQLIN